MFWKLTQRQNCWIRPWTICPDHWFWSSRHLEIEAIWYLGPLSFCCASESCPTSSPGSVWHLSFTRVTTPPNLALPLSFSSSIVPGSEIQPGTASPAILSSPQAQYLPAWLISSQTLRWWINHNTAHTHWHQEEAYLLGVLLVILKNFESNLMHNFILLRFKDHCCF